MERRPSSRHMYVALALVVLVSGLVFASTAFASVTRYEETAPSVTYTGTWTPSPLPGHSSGSVEYSADAPNATATLAFSGTGVDWIAAKWYNRGIAAVSLDGGPEQMVDLYADGVPGDTNTVSYQQILYSVRNLTNDPHTLRIRVTGNHRAAASSPYLITVDAFDVFVEPPMVSTPSSSPWSLALVVMIGFAGLGVAATAKRRARA